MNGINASALHRAPDSESLQAPLQIHAHARITQTQTRTHKLTLGSCLTNSPLNAWHIPQLNREKRPHKASFAHLWQQYDLKKQIKWKWLVTCFLVHLLRKVTELLSSTSHIISDIIHVHSTNGEGQVRGLKKIHHQPYPPIKQNKRCHLQRNLLLRYKKARPL